MQVTFTENPPSFNLEIDYSVEESLKSFKEEVLSTLYDLYKKHNVERLLLSDGMDSSFTALCLQELGITFRPLSFIFSKQKNFVTEDIVKFCNKNGFTPSFFVIEPEPFFKHIEYLTEEKKLAYPVLNGYYVDYMLNNFSENFFSGMTCEFKYYDNKYIDFGMIAPYLVKRNNLNRLYGFANSRTFLSYINNPIFLNNYKIDRSKLRRDDPFFIRDLIYTNIYPEMGIKRKSGWDDQIITKPFEQKYLPKIKKEVPWVFKLENYKFYVDDYFKGKYYV